MKLTERILPSRRGWLVGRYEPELVKPLGCGSEDGPPVIKDRVLTFPEHTASDSQEGAARSQGSLRQGWGQSPCPGQQPLTVPMEVDWYPY